MQDLQIIASGVNDFNQISIDSYSNNSSKARLPDSITAPNQFSTYYQHSILVKDKKAYSIGPNTGNKISSNKTEPDKWVYITIKVNTYTLAAVCGSCYTLYVINNGYSQLRIALYWQGANCGKPFILNNYSVREIYGGDKTAVAILNNKMALVFSESMTMTNYYYHRPFSVKLPSLPINVACLEKSIIFHLNDGIYEASFDNIQKEKMSLKKINTKDQKINYISGTFQHFFYVTDKGKVFARGDNSFGKLGVGENIKEITDFVDVSALSNKKIVKAYAGYNHSLFIDDKGAVYSCGENKNNSLLLNEQNGKNVFIPTLTKVKSGAISCIAGRDISIVFGKFDEKTMKEIQEKNEEFKKEKKSNQNDDKQKSNQNDDKQKSKQNDDKQKSNQNDDKQKSKQNDDKKKSNQNDDDIDRLFTDFLAEIKEDMKSIQEKCNEQDDEMNKFVKDHNETVNFFCQFLNNLKKSTNQATKDDDDDYDNKEEDSNHFITKSPKTGHKKLLKIPPEAADNKSSQSKSSYKLFNNNNNNNAKQQPTKHRYVPANSKYAASGGGCGDANKSIFKTPNNSSPKSHAGQGSYVPPPNYTGQKPNDFPPGFSNLFPLAPPQNSMKPAAQVYQPNSDASSLAYTPYGYPPGFSDQSASNETSQKRTIKSAYKPLYDPSATSAHQTTAAYKPAFQSNLSTAYKPVPLPTSSSPQPLPATDDDNDDDETFTNCYIKNLPANYEDENLRQLFSQYGTPVAFKVARDNNGMSLKFGFCSMSTHQEALNAIKNLNGIEIDGKQIICCRHLNKQKRSKEIEENTEKWRQSNLEKYKGRNLFVRDIDASVTSDELKAAYSLFGEIESAEVMRDSSGKSKKYAYICFKKVEDAQKCILQQSLVKIHDRTPTVVLSTSPEERQKNISEF